MRMGMGRNGRAGSPPGLVLRRIILMVGVASATAAASYSSHRVVVVVGQADDPRCLQQHAALRLDGAALRERDVIVQDLTPEAARRLHPAFGLGAQAVFEVLLLGKDGQVKLRRDRPVEAAEITALIDTMPMRQDEMRQRDVGRAGR